MSGLPETNGQSLCRSYLVAQRGFGTLALTSHVSGRRFSREREVVCGTVWLLVSFASLSDRTVTNLPYDASGKLVRQNGFGTINGVRAPRTLQLVTRVTFERGQLEVDGGRRSPRSAGPLVASPKCGAT